MKKSSAGKLPYKKPLLDDLRYICGGELITVLSIDGVKERRRWTE